MTFFIVVLIGFLAITLILAPLAWRAHCTNVSLLADIQTVQLQMADVLREEEQYRMACLKATDGLVIQDMRGKILWCNPAYCRIHDRPAASITGRNPLEFAVPKHLAKTPEQIAESPFDLKEGEVQRFLNQRPSGETFWIELSSSFHNGSDGERYAVVVCRDVSRQVEQEEQLRDIRVRLEHEASHDPLTGIANRAAFLSFIDRALATPQRKAVGLLHIDLDNFKDVNDTHGHSAGDALLRHVASILRRTLRDEDLVARTGGDEFVVVFTDVKDLDHLASMSNALLAAISKPLRWSARTLRGRASIGGAFAADENVTSEDLLVQADFALYDAKRAGRNCTALYDERLHLRHVRQMYQAVELTSAVESGAFEYAFQPKMNLETGRVVGFETLVRWHHPDEGLIPPDDFLPMAKDLGLMGALDFHSMQAALAQKRRLDLAGHDGISIAFNASPDLLTHPDFLTRLIWEAEAADINRGEIAIEVLETTDFSTATSTGTAASIISDLRAAGFQVHLDDFGIGFAGLSHLASVDVTGVKVDRGLVTCLLNNDTNRKIVRKIVELSNDLGLKVIAEGVEDSATATALHHMGCGEIQGYWLSKPLPQSEVETWLGDQQSLWVARRA